MDFETVTKSVDAVSINQLTYKIIDCFSKEVLDNPSNWHKFIIDNVQGLKRHEVLKILFDYIKPLDLIPLHYVEEGKGAYFFARVCGEAVRKICKNKVTVPNPVSKQKPFNLQIILKYTTTTGVKVDLSANLMKVLKKRLHNGTLNLTNFVEDSDLIEFFLLSQPKILAFVLNAARTLKLKALKLCHNEIRTLDAFKILPSKNIYSVDLRHNLIKDLAELKYLENFHITELWLEGNPLCELYDEYSYIQQIIKYCPHVEKLDGFLLRQNGVPSFRRNFLCDIDAYDIVDNFLETYFTTFDTKNLEKLALLYHDEALFSMTVDYIENQLSSSNSQYLFNTYKIHSRNFLNNNQKTHSTDNLYMGCAQIVDLFKKLPQTEHDPYSFTVDVLMYSKKCTIIVVTGVFREVPAFERLLGFNRYFVIELHDKTYRIKNEQLHIFNALTSQQATAFKKLNIFEEANNLEEKNQMVNALAVITDLTKDFAKMFLEECHYNLKHATLLFVDLYNSDKIPSRGFKTLE